jgi:hypothetical protein
MSWARLKSGAVKFWEETIGGAPRFSPYRFLYQRRSTVRDQAILTGGAVTQKKYSPPHPLDTKGCCSPQNNPKNSS